MAVATHPPGAMPWFSAPPRVLAGFVPIERKFDPLVERVMKIAQCGVCGNEYDKALGTPDTHAPIMLTVSLAS